jgi:Xaa-Pro aminopeptidase
MKNYILQNENGIYFECGYSCDNVIFLSLGGDNYFITDGRYEIEAKLYAKNCEVVITRDLLRSARKILKKSKIKKLHFDPHDFSFFSYKKLQENLSIKFIEKPNFSKIKRIIKTDQEIQYLQKAMSLGREGFDNFANYIKENGIKQSEKTLFFKAKEYLSFQGSYDLSFDPIVAINENSAKPHALPTDDRLYKNDLLLVDAGLKYKRYCSDRTCTSKIDKNINFSREQKFATKLEQKVYDTVRLAQEKAIEKARVGMKASKIDKLARDVIEKAGFGKYFVHSTGHGVGLDIHEYPSISARNDLIIEDNMVFTIEPGIYLTQDCLGENKGFGVRIEDTVVMKNGKVKIL